MDRRAPSHQLQGVSCPHCGQEPVAASGLTTSRTPMDGDVQICGGCHRASVFVAGPLGLGARLPTDAEQAAIDSDPVLKAALGALAESYDSWDAADLAYRGGPDG